MSFRLAVFDMDGTVFSSHLNWKEIRKELSIPEDTSILEDIFGRSLHDGKINRIKLAKLEAAEEANTRQSQPIANIERFLNHLRVTSTKTALITNNNRQNTEYLLNKYGFSFDIVITREMDMWKPGPEAFLHVLKISGIKAHETISFGDSIYDALASKRANIPNIFIINHNNSLDVKRFEGLAVSFFSDYNEMIDMYFRNSSIPSS